MLKNLKNACKNWWLLLILGILCIVAGILILCTPFGGVTTLSIILMITLIIVGIVGVIFVISNRKDIPAWGWDLVLPILTIIAGIILAFCPTASNVFVIILCAAGILFKSIEAICYAISLSGIKGSGWGWSLAAGIIGLILSIFLFANPLFTGIVVSVFVGVGLTFLGIESIVLSVQMSKIKAKIQRAEDAVEEA